MLATAGHVAHPAAQQLARSGATSGATSRDQHGRDARPACISYAASSARRRPTLGQSALLQRPASVPQSCNQCASMSRPSHDQHARMSRTMRDIARAHAAMASGGVPPPMAAAGGQLLRCLGDYLAGNSCLAPTGITRTPALHGRRRKIRQSGPRPDAILLRQPALEGLTRSARTDSPRNIGRNKFRRSGGGGGGVHRRRRRRGFWRRGETALRARFRVRLCSVLYNEA
ncbi:hypothetical protein F511_09812 [Dorcoceras hygrometricum]|uniref:Uncharacterized protein n=1 Tax=Dorcoceras hygrometricum TaxID=472368 RepID=A0A2Z7ARE1_9LAMI|nr:hypothetical protein F511_09812 [Dorcoceras hygrometricum]